MATFNNTDVAAFKDVWVFCEQRHGKLMPTDFELISEGRKLADDLGVKLCGVLLGDGVEGVAKELGGYGADEIIVCESPLLKDYTTDAYAKVICDVIQELKPEVFLIGASNIGRDLGPRCAARLHTGLCADCTHLDVDMLLLFGTVFGRLICGFLCPFGFVQDLLYKIRTKKAAVSTRLDRPLRKVKYVVLILLVLLLPALARGPYGVGDPWFCKYLCPAGTLEGGIPLLLQNAGLRELAGFLFSWKLAILLVVLVGSVLLYRPFCKYLCPLGAIYGLFNRLSVYRMGVDASKCTHCGAWWNGGCAPSAPGHPTVCRWSGGWSH